MKSTTPMTPASRRAFTLIEILVVVAIIAILAAIAIPNLLQAQTRSKVSRIKADMKSLATAIEAYAVDHNDYPVRRHPNTASKPQVPLASNRLLQMSAVTTPVSYISSLPTDVFEKHLVAPNNVIDYYDRTQTSWLINSRYPTVTDPRRVNEESCGWLLISVGPDTWLGPVQPVLHGWPTPNDPTLSTLGTIFINYDPTNGTVSTGNIYSGNRGPEGTTAYLQPRFL